MNRAGLASAAAAFRACRASFGKLGFKRQRAAALAINVAALEDLLLRIARLADDLPEVLALSLEPVIVGPADPWHGGRSLVVAGAAVRVGAPTARVDPGPRRMFST